MMVVGRYVAGNMKQQWMIDGDQICSQFGRELRVVVDGAVTAGARCRASDRNSSTASWLFDH